MGVVKSKLIMGAINGEMPKISTIANMERELRVNVRA